MKIIIYPIFILLLAYHAGAQQDVQLIREKEQLLESVGTLASSNLYLAYLSLTLLKNDIENGTSTSNYKDIMQPVEMSLNLINTQLEKMQGITNLSEDDYAIISSIAKATDMLRKDSVLLTKYLEENNENILEEFNEHHKTTGEFLRQLFMEEDNE